MLDFANEKEARARLLSLADELRKTKAVWIPHKTIRSPKPIKHALRLCEMTQ